MGVVEDVICETVWYSDLCELEFVDVFGRKQSQVEELLLCPVDVFIVE